VVVVDQLAIWLYGDVVALLQSNQGRLRLTYTSEALERFALGTPLLSLSMTLRIESYTDGVVRPFIEGLLPEGEARRVIAYDLGIDEADTYGLIRALGKDCAGAMVIQPVEDPPPVTPSVSASQPISSEELEGLIRNLHVAPLGVEGRVKVSLAGYQEKLVLTRRQDGTWGRPVDGTPSTHILKPEVARFPGTVANEAFGLRFVGHLGLDVASVETIKVGSAQILVVERFDRYVNTSGEIHRIHQEDFCQALGLLPAKKYQNSGGPSLKRIAAALAATADVDSLDRLLRAIVVNVLLGNGDAHAKNFSLLHEGNGRLTLAPLYDLLNTFIYGDNTLAMYIDDVRRVEEVTIDRILNEAVSWGMNINRARNVVDDLLGRVPAAMALARNQTEEVQPEIVKFVTDQLGRLKPIDGRCL